MTNAEFYLKDSKDTNDFISKMCYLVSEYEEEYGDLPFSELLGEWLIKKTAPKLTEIERIILENMQIAGNKAECIERTANTGYLRVYTQTR